MARKSKKSKAKTSKLKSLKQSAGDRRIPKIAAVMLTLLAVYLAIAFVSYLYTWKADQDQVFDFSWSLLFDQALEVENWLGRFGAVVSNAFFFRGVGLSAFIVIFVILKLAYILFTERSFWKILPPIQYALTFILYMSPLLAFIFTASGFPWGGAFGDYLTAWLSEFVGRVGTGLLFLFLGFAFIVWNFHHISTKSTFSFRLPGVSFRQLMQRKATEVLNANAENADESWSTPEEIEAQKKATSSVPDRKTAMEKGSLEFEISVDEAKSRKSS